MKYHKFIFTILLIMIVINVFSQYTESSLIIEEYQIVSADIATPDNIGFKKYIDPNIHEKRSKWRKFTKEFFGENDIEKMNNILNDHDYHFQVIKEMNGNQSDYSFCYKDSVILQKIFNIRGFDYDKKNNSFIFIVRQWDNHRSKQYKFYFDGKILDMKSYSDISRIPFYFTPIIVDTKVIEIVYIGKKHKYYGLGDTLKYAVKVNSEVVTHFTTVQKTVDSPVKSFYQNNNDWILEYEDNAIVNGFRICEKYDLDKIFSFVYLGSKPFFFFDDNNHISISYNEENYNTKYDEVIHYKCCEPSLFNVWNNNVMVSFFALRDGYWYYVEAGVYD